QPAAGPLRSLALMPELALAALALGALSALGAVWTPLLLALPLFLTTAALAVVQAVAAARDARFASGLSRPGRAHRLALTTPLFVLQPLARLRGRYRLGLTPWRRRGRTALVAPWPRTTWLWSEEWRSPEARLGTAVEALRGDGIAAAVGGDFDRWDLEVRGGLLGCARLLMAIEEHGNGNQLVRIRRWPRNTRLALAAIVVMLALTAAALVDGEELLALVFAGLAGLRALRALVATTSAAAPLWQAFQPQQEPADDQVVSPLRLETTRMQESNAEAGAQ